MDPHGASNNELSHLNVHCLIAYSTCFFKLACTKKVQRAVVVILMLASAWEEPQ